MKREKNGNLKRQGYQWTFVKMFGWVFFQTYIPDKEEPVAHWAGLLDMCNHLFWPNYKLLKALIFPFHSFLMPVLFSICTDNPLLAEAKAPWSMWNPTCNSATACKEVSQLLTKCILAALLRDFRLMQSLGLGCICVSICQMRSMSQSLPKY